MAEKLLWSGEGLMRNCGGSGRFIRRSIDSSSDSSSDTPAESLSRRRRLTSGDSVTLSGVHERDLGVSNDDLGDETAFSPIPGALGKTGARRFWQAVTLWSARSSWAFDPEGELLLSVKRR